MATIYHVIKTSKMDPIKQLLGSYPIICESLSCSDPAWHCQQGVNNDGKSKTRYVCKSCTNHKYWIEG